MAVQTVRLHGHCPAARQAGERKIEFSGYELARIARREYRYERRRAGSGKGVARRLVLAHLLLITGRAIRESGAD